MPCPAQSCYKATKFMERRRTPSSCLNKNLKSLPVRDEGTLHPGYQNIWATGPFLLHTFLVVPLLSCNIHPELGVIQIFGSRGS